MCKYIHDNVAATSDMDKTIRDAKGRLDWLLITGDSVAKFWLNAIEYAAKNATAGGWKIRVILMKPDAVLCHQASVVSGTPANTIHAQIGDVRKKLDNIRVKYPQGIDTKYLDRVPPCTMWLADDSTVKRVNIETIFCTDNGDGPVFRCTDPSLFAKCVTEFEALWAQAQ